MKAPLRFCVLGASLVLVSGCFLVPTEVPAELLAVKDDPNAFSKAGHPLTELAVGTVIDDLDLLDGC